MILTEQNLTGGCIQIQASLDTVTMSLDTPDPDIRYPEVEDT